MIKRTWGGCSRALAARLVSVLPSCPLSEVSLSIITAFPPLGQLPETQAAPNPAESSRMFCAHSPIEACKVRREENEHAVLIARERRYWLAERDQL